VQPTAEPRPVAGEADAAALRRPFPARPRGVVPATVARPALALATLALAVGLTACSPTTDPDPLPTPSGAAAPAVPTPGPSGDGGTSTPSAEPTTGPGSEPEAQPTTGTVPTPDEHTAVGGLAPGFPTSLLPLPQDAEILVSTWAPVGAEGAGQPYDVSLNVRTALAVADVAALYRASLTAAGFTESVGAPTGGLGAESTYSRSAGAELLTVGVLDRDDARTVTVGGRVHASG
jgi:hypothetical protein